MVYAFYFRQFLSVCTKTTTTNNTLTNIKFNEKGVYGWLVLEKLATKTVIVW